MPLGRVLANLAVDSETKHVLDPMAGSGDLLDAVSEAASACGAQLQRLDAIEVNKTTAAVCERRLQRVCGPQNVAPQALWGDAFNPATYDAILKTGYDLVITNPPYVRYQSLNGHGTQVRCGLMDIVNQHLFGSTQEVWRALADGYSGLADLSVPSWLLSALLVRPDGRLALVVPATWRSRAYADAIRYLQLRCFQLELIVEDTQPGWFSDALVRTHLIVARRLPEDQVAEPLSARSNWPAALWAKIAPEAASSKSLIGNAFQHDRAEADFATWCRAAARPEVPGISVRTFSLEEEWRALRAQAAGRTWMKALEISAPDQPLFSRTESAAASVPEALRDLLPASFDRQALRTLDDTGIRAGQGLRTGCNRFFYVRLIQEDAEAVVRVETDLALGGRTLLVSATALQSVLHRQADLEAWRNGLLPATRVLDLRRMVLPEDMDQVRTAAKLELMPTEELPTVMPEKLAAHVRAAAETTFRNGANALPVSALSAVRTNVRPARGGSLPRYWYMLPDFKPRHLPQAFVPRIIHDAPRVYANTEPTVLIDANFSTFWTDRESWTAHGLAAFLNCSWCRTVMEAAGTPLGGGALKLEAVHLRKMPVPHLAAEAVQVLNDVGRRAQGRQDQQKNDRIVLRAVLNGNPSETEIDTFAALLSERRAALGAARQRGSA